MKSTETMLPDDEIEVRYVNGVREVRTFRPFEPKAAAGIPIRENGVYLITGGLGGLGLIFARYLVHERGARVVLMGRSPLDAAIADRLGEFGNEALYVQGDVCDEADVRRCIETARATFGPIAGVIHAAGLNRDAFIRHKQAEEAALVLRPKTVGIAVLDKATANEPLEFFVAFSSIAGVTGNVGQCDYAFANAYLDAFIAARAELQARGERPGRSLSINWPLWKDGGMQLDPELAALKTGGLPPLETAEGLRIFEAALASGESQVTAVVTNPAPTADSPPGMKNLSPTETASSPPAELGALALLIERFSGLTKIPHDRIRPNEPLEHYGIDSILVMSFTKLLEQDFGPLSKTLLFEYQTLQDLAAYFEAHHAETLRRLRGTATPEPSARSEPVVQAVESPPRPVPSRENDPDIAIIGLYGRFPKAESPDELWRNLTAGRDCIQEVPPERWDVRDYFDPKPSAAGKTYNRWGGFLTDIDKFDSLFFRILPREAEGMDPQERLFLETVWNTLEDAGYRKSALRQRPVGVFVGVMYGHYQLLGLEQSRPGQLLALGSSYASIANRVSYFFDWNGPSLAVDTMCSSSLTAIHLACESLRRGESELAIAGGVNLALHPLKDVGLAQGGYAAEDGRCKSFAAAGDGYVPGEGVGAVLLKPRSRAVADGDHIYAVIRAGCINHGGKTNGYSVPNPNAQADLIAAALKQARIDPRTLSYVEAHGTGTALGDPIEITGLSKAFQRAADGELPRQYCAIGSVKSNIGHLEAAAGVAGLTKVLLQMRHRELAPSLHARDLNPHIPFEDTPFVLQRQAGPWTPPAGAPRRAGISSFGAGGANAHLIVEEFVADVTTAAAAIPGPYLMLFSAANDDRLTALVRRFHEWVTHLPEADRPNLADLAFTLQVGREALDERLAFLVSDWDEFAERLSRALDPEPSAALRRGNARREAGRSDALLSGEEGRQFLEALIRGRNLEKLAGLWVTGIEIEWEALWRDRPGRRVGLPVYPFARVRHWPAPPWEPAAPVDSRAARLSALVHWNESTLREPRFGSRFDVAETVIRDHRVEGRPMLPGAAIIEMVWQAVRLAAETDAIQLQDLVWLQPCVADDQGLEVRVALHPKGPDTLAFQLRAADGAVKAEGKATLAATGESAGPAFESVRARCPRRIEPAEFYSGFAALGLDYGPGFRAVREIGAGEDEVWSLLERPTDWGAETYRLHPALLDGAFQSLAMLSADGGLELPFSVERIISLTPLPDRCLAIGRRSGTAGAGVRRYDIEILDLEGRELARIQGFMTRHHGAVPARGERLLFRPNWTSTPILTSAEPAGGSVLLFDDRAELAEALQGLGVNLIRVSTGADDRLNRPLAVIRPDRSEDYERLLGEVEAGAILHIQGQDASAESIRRLHCLTQAVVRRARPVRLLHLYASGDPAGEAVGAYAGSLRLEQPRLRLKALGVERTTPAATLAAILLAELRDESLDVRYAHGKRLLRSLEEIPSGAIGTETTIPRGGVFLVTGGLGGLALIFAACLVEEFDARVVLVGRSALDEARAQRLKPLADRVGYLQADISRLDEAARVVAETKRRHGRLDGVFHAAGVLRDGLIWNKTVEDFDAVLKPKMAGVEALDEATKAEPLSLFVVFSSTAGLFGNAGQADYAYANAYLDAFAHRRERRRLAGTRQGRTLSIDWPLWSEGGMRADADRLSAIGLEPLDRASGWALFKQALASGEAQVWACLGDRAAIRGWLSAASFQRPASSGQPPAAGSLAESRKPEAGSWKPTREQVIDYLIQRFAELTKLQVADVLPDEPIENYGLDSIMVSTFSQMLEHDLGDLSRTILFEYPTLEALGAYLLDQHAAGLARALGRSDAGDAEIPASPEPVGAACAIEPAMPVDAPDVAPVPKATPTTIADDPIAIIGVAGRYPMAADLDEFWANLAAGRDCIEEVPRERWTIENYYDPQRMTPGKTSNKWGGFIRDMDRFDPVFFNISPLEAGYMDPQERLFLETVWHTLEDAGCTKTSLDDRKVGVFVGAMYGHYQLYGVEERLKGNPVSLSSNFSTIANRVSYFFNWHGPSLALDSMCSSSLTTIHLACESLRRGECELAVAGGVNATVHPEKDLILSQSGFSASDGRCRAFGEGGDGYVPAEGVGALLLMPLSRARAEGRRVQAVIRASALNHGGKTNGYTVPNSRSQADVILSALRQSGLDPATITYIEAHGTGTVLGDPIEIEGLQQAFTTALDRRPQGPDDRFCAIGSVKSNIGHCESAAGIAAVTKVLLQMRHGWLVPSIHTDVPNPRIRFDQTFFRVQRVLEPWTPPVVEGRRLPRRAGISSFGAGGANAHLILEESLDAVDDMGDGAETAAGPEILVLSARTPEQLKEMAANLGRFLSADRMPDDADHRAGSGRRPSLRDVAFTLQSGREALPQRLAMVVDDLDEGARRLSAWSASDAPIPSLHLGCAGRASSGRDAPTPPTAGDLDGWAAWWVAGGTVDWVGLRGGARARFVSLPGYPFLRQRFWVPNRTPPRDLDRAEAETRPSDRALSPPRSDALAPDGRFFVPVWERSRSEKTGIGSWERVLLIHSSDHPLNDALIQASRAPLVQRMRLGRASRTLDEGRWEADLSDPLGIVWCLKQMARPDLILFTGSIGPHASGDAVARSEQAQQTGVIAFFRTIEAAHALGWFESPPAIRLVTAGALEVEPGESVRPEGAGLVGAAGSLAREQRQLDIACLDLDPLDLDDPARLAGNAAAVLTEPPQRAGEIVAWRAGERRQQRLRLVQLPEPEASAFRRHGVYLIIGGTGNIGRILGSGLARHHGARLVLTGRRPPDGEIERQLAHLRQDGGEARYVQARVDDLAEMQGALDLALREFGRIDGVIHSAMVMQHALARDMEEHQIRQVLDPKTRGSAVLLELTRDLPLDFLLFMGSAQSFLHEARRAVYAAACCTSDAYAQVARRQASFPVRVIHWGFWAHSLDAAMGRNFAAAGLGGIRPEDGFAAVERILAGGLDAVGYLRANDEALSRLGLHPEPKALHSGVDRARIRRDLAALIEGVLQLSSGDLDTRAPFTEVGVDSIVSVALIGRINETFGSRFQPTVLFDYSTVERLADHLAAVIPGTPDPNPVAGETPLEEPEAEPVAPPSGQGDIAIIGYSGRFPGAADVEQFWENLAAGRSSIVEVPADRWDSATFYDPNSKRPDRTNSKWGGFLDRVDAFDPLFFNISGREAEVTDPQHRVFLEEAYHALEHAGYAGPAARIPDKCGLFVGVEPGDYIHRVTASTAAQEHAPIFQGNAESILAARLCYHLDLKGPAIAVNTACSSSLVAIHLACRTLLSGECDLALAGGVRILATEKAYLALGSLGMLSPDGQCKTFDEAANGFVPGEGVGVLVLKPLAAARRDGDSIHAVIRGSAINQDGRTNGITAPSSLSQTAVELEAYARAGISPESLQYVEAHGTGTRLGDPIEVQALTEAFRKQTSRNGFCALGSVKTNIGHGMAAAGVSAAIKVLLSLRHGQIPPSLNFRQANAHIDFAHSPFFVNTELREWPQPPGQPRRAAVSSFGFSGTNAHLVLEEAPSRPRPGRPSKPAYLFTLSAKTREALNQLLERFSTIESDETSEDVSFTLNLGREHFHDRCAVVADSLQAFRATLTALARDGQAANGWLSVGADVDDPDEAVHRELIAMILKELPELQHSDPERYRHKLAALAALYVKGFDLDWSPLHQGESRRRVPLPGYPFARESYWVSAAPMNAAPPSGVLHPLVQRRLTDSPTGVEFAASFQGTEFFLAGHRISGRRTLPGVAYLEMALAANRLAGREPNVVLSRVTWLRPLIVEGETSVLVRLTDLEPGWRFEVRSGDDRTLYAEGSIRPSDAGAERRADLAAIRARCRRHESGEAIAARCAEAGLELGAGFRGLRDLWFSDDEALSLIELPESALARAGDFLAHPILLDGALQTTAALGDGRGSGIPVPFAIEEAVLGPLPSRCHAHVRRDSGGPGLLRFRIDLLDDSGLVIGALKGVAMRALSPISGTRIEPLYARPQWGRGTHRRRRSIRRRRAVAVVRRRRGAGSGVAGRVSGHPDHPGQAGERLS
jgi:polyketide synthase PksL